MVEYVIKTTLDNKVQDSLEILSGSDTYNSIANEVGHITIQSEDSYSSGSGQWSKPGEGTWVVNVNPYSGALVDGRVMTLPEIIAHEVVHAKFKDQKVRIGDQIGEMKEESKVIELANKINSELHLPTRTDLGIDPRGKNPVGSAISFIDFVTGVCIPAVNGFKDTVVANPGGHLVRPYDDFMGYEVYSAYLRSSGDDPRNDGVREIMIGSPGLADLIRGAGEVVDGVLNNTGIVGDKVGDVIKTGMNAAATVVDVVATGLSGLVDIFTGDDDADRRSPSSTEKNEYPTPSPGAKDWSTPASSSGYGTNGTSGSGSGSGGSTVSYSNGAGNSPGTSATYGNSGSGPSYNMGTPVTTTTYRPANGIGPQPVILDLDGNGIQVTEVNKSNVFMDAGDDGLKHRTAWAAAGNGVLFWDSMNDGVIRDTREYVFTEWDASADSGVAEPV